MSNKKPTKLKVLKSLQGNKEPQNALPQQPNVNPDKIKLTGNELVDFLVDYFKTEIGKERVQRKEMEFQIKMLKNRIKSMEIDFVSLGYTFSELGLVPIEILNTTKNQCRDKIAVQDRNGNIKGREIFNRFNLAPKGEFLVEG